MLLTVLLVALTAGVYAFKDMQTGQSARSMTYVELDGPQSVLLELDGKRLNKGRYARLPYRIKVGVGEHKLKVMRQGFITKVFGLKIKQTGDVLKRNLLLKRDPRARTAPVKISLKGADSVSIDLDQGFFTTELNSIAPIHLKKDILFGVEHQLMIRRKRSPKAYLCRFTPRSFSLSNPYHIVVFPRSEGFACKVYNN
jgi:hypothetical protein